ncbi:MAG: serine protease [Pseudomonadota bacterium]
MVNEILLTVTLIVQLVAGKPVGTATGFFYSRGDDLFLVTNRHVVKDDDKKVYPDTLRLRLHTDANDVTKSTELDVPILNKGAPLWKTHPKHTVADVALIRLDRASLLKRFVVKAWARDSFLPADLLLAPGEDVFIMGFPRGFHDSHHNLPILRDAMIASAYRVPFLNNPLFLTDANLHPGTSGSPVITKPKSAWVDTKGNTRIVTGTVYYLVGVHSGTISPSITGGQDIGLGAAWYAELLEEIASSF